MDNNLKIVLTGGGSGGHVIPALALIPDLHKTFKEIYYVGTNGLEKKLALDAGLSFHEITAAGLDRKKVFRNLKIPFVLFSAIVDCIKYFKKIKPDVVFGKGGFVQMPAVVAARLLHVPVVCHESDLTLGLANKIAFKLGAQILTSFDKTATLSSKFICSGFPLRKSLFTGNKQNVMNSHHLDASKKTILVLGGSLGADAINTAIFNVLPTLLKRYNVIHVTGKNKGSGSTFSGYIALEFVENVWDYYAAADIVISRCGAGALSEITALQIPSIFIPLPKTASRGDQIKNAEIATEHGAQVILQENLADETLLNAIYKCGVKTTPVGACGNRKISDILTSFADNHKSSL